MSVAALNSYLIDSVACARGPIPQYQCKADPVLTLEPVEVDTVQDTPSSAPSSAPHSSPSSASSTEQIRQVQLTMRPSTCSPVPVIVSEAAPPVPVKDQAQVDLDHLIKIHTADCWAGTKGTLYTSRMTGFIPRQGAIMWMINSGYKLRGRIVCTGGAVIDCDTANAIQELTDSDMPGIRSTFEEAAAWHKRWHNLVPASKISCPVNETHVPPGEYTLLEKSLFNETAGRFSVAGVICCDNPKCCLMNHVIISVLPDEIKTKEINDGQREELDLSPNRTMVQQALEVEQMKDLFLTRPMYKKHDLILGDYDVCHKCIMEACASDTE